MAAGLQIWNSSGVLILDLTDRISRVLGRVTIDANSSGYITDSRFALGTIWWQVLSPNSLAGAYAPNMVAEPSNNRIAYTPHVTFSAAVNVDVIYGVY